MAYDLKSAMNKVLGLKKDKHIAGNVVHSIDGMNAEDYYEKQINESYKKMKDNGYGVVADNLKQKNYPEAKKYSDSYYIKTGRSAIRPYLYQKGKEYNIAESEIDKMLSYDNDTGEVTFAGKNIGKPAGVVDGSSYFDPDYLEKVWGEYAKDSGISRSSSTLAGNSAEDIRVKMNKAFGNAENDRKLIIEKYEDFHDYNTGFNPYESDIGKSIMKEFNFKGERAADDTVAERAGSNGGNIDSFAAANAARQQLAYTVAGERAVLDDFNARAEREKDAIDSFSDDLRLTRADEYNLIALNQNEAARLTEAAENEKKNKTEDLKTVAEVTGYVPKEWRDRNNPYLNADGSLKDVKIDYNARITELENALKSETDPEVIKDIKENIGWLNDARAIKVTLPEYRKFALDRPVIFSGNERTADYDITDKQIESAEKIALAGYDAERDINKETVEGNVRMNETSENAETMRNQDNNSTAVTVAGMEKDVAMEKVLADMGAINQVEIPMIDEDSRVLYDISMNGVEFLEALKYEADTRGGHMTDQAVLDFVMKNAGKYKINLEEVKNIYYFLKLSRMPLENLEDVSKKDASKGLKVKGHGNE